MLNSMVGRWPVGSLYKIVLYGEPFTKRGLNDVWVKAKGAKEFNAVNLRSGEVDKLSPEEMVYLIDCRITEK